MCVYNSIAICKCTYLCWRWFSCTIRLIMSAFSFTNSSYDRSSCWRTSKSYSTTAEPPAWRALRTFFWQARHRSDPSSKCTGRKWRLHVRHLGSVEQLWQMTTLFCVRTPQLRQYSRCDWSGAGLVERWRWRSRRGWPTGMLRSANKQQVINGHINSKRD